MSYNIAIYKTKDGKSEIQVTLEKDTVWLSINQLAQLFERDKSVISRHIKNIFSEKELTLSSTVAKNATVPQNEGGRIVERKIDLYNLDVIISVGYRVKSIRGTQFRQWANQKLRDYLIKGYAINQKRLAEKEEEIQFLRSGIRIAKRAIEEKAATLLYLIVKNHAFTDGNKRIAAACFLMFLKRNNLLVNNKGNMVISNEALASLTLFIASSKAEEMETAKKLIIRILNRNKSI